MNGRIEKFAMSGLVVACHVFVGCEKVVAGWSSFSLREFLLGPILLETPEDTKNLWIALGEAKSPEDFQKVWEKAVLGGKLKAEAWRCIRKTSKTCRQWLWIHRKATDIKEKNEAWSRASEKLSELLVKK